MPEINQVSHILFMVTICLCVPSGVRYFKYRTPMARWGGLFLFSLAIELFCYSYRATGAASSHLPIWYIVQYLSFYLLANFWLLFVTEIAGLTRKVNMAAALSLPGILTLGFAGLLAASAVVPGALQPKQGVQDSFFRLPALIGPPGTFYILVYFGLVILSFLILLRLCIKTNAASRKMVIAMLLGTFLLGLLSMLEQFGLTPTQPYHLSQLGFAGSSWTFFFVTIIWRFGGILPVSRENVFEGTHDGVLVLDYFETIVDINEQALKSLGLNRKAVLNQTLANAWPFAAQLIASHPGETLIEEECEISIGGQEHNFDITVSQFMGLNNISIGRLIVMRNVTSRERMEKALHNHAQELQKTNAFLAGLAEVTVNLHTTADPSKIATIVGSELKKLGLESFIAHVDAETGDLVFKYVSLAQDIITRIESILGFQLNGFRLEPKQFPRLYDVIETGQVNYRELSPNALTYGSGKIPAKILKQALTFLGLVPKKKALALPFVTNTRTLGVLCVWGGNLEETDIVPLRIFASQVAYVLERAILYENEKRRTSELSRSNGMIMALSKVAAQLDSTSELRQVFATLGEEMNRVQMNCMVGTLDDTKQVMKIEFLSISSEVIAWAEKLGAFWPKEITIPRHLWPTDKAVNEKVPYWDPDPISSTCKMFPFIPRQVFVKTFEMAGMNMHDQVCYLPMISEEDVFGILAVWGPRLRSEDIPGLTIFTNQVATAIKNARLYHQAQKEIAERKQAEACIQQALNEKEVLLKEVHHRVKNNLQVISSLLNLQAAQILDPATVDLLHESQNRVRTMALIHEKLYQSNNLARVDFSGYLHSLVNSLAQTYQVKPDRVAIYIACENIELDIDTAIPCGLIVNELVSNSMKYAFPSGRTGTIEVYCRHINDRCCQLVVSDNGIGLSDGFNIARSASLGLKLVTSLTHQIEGEISINGKQGARFEITFKGC